MSACDAGEQAAEVSVVRTVCVDPVEQGTACIVVEMGECGGDEGKQVLGEGQVWYWENGFVCHRVVVEVDEELTRSIPTADASLIHVDPRRSQGSHPTASRANLQADPQRSVSSPRETEAHSSTQPMHPRLLQTRPSATRRAP